jgi:hypothetical protein
MSEVNRAHGRKEKHDGSEPKDQAARERAQYAKSEPLFHRSCGAQTCNHDGSDRCRYSRPIDRVIHDVTQRGAETDLESEGDIILVFDSIRNQERDISGARLV